MVFTEERFPVAAGSTSLLRNASDISGRRRNYRRESSLQSRGRHLLNLRLPPVPKTTTKKQGQSKMNSLKAK
ncbi:unnamed protein product, partial [Amoebophrya sp. A25]|eukprot:GSA25T00017405001.1